MSFNVGGGPVVNGMTPRNSFGGYPEITGYGQQQYYSNGMKPQIYTVRDSLTPSTVTACPTKSGHRFFGRMLI